MMFFKKGVAYIYPVLKVRKMLLVNQTWNKMLEKNTEKKKKKKSDIIGNIV